jgi:hypothetical protein
MFDPRRNLVHGVLDRLGVALPENPLCAAHWADGNAASLDIQLGNGAVCHVAWLLLAVKKHFYK